MMLVLDKPREQKPVVVVTYAELNIGTEEV